MRANGATTEWPGTTYSVLTKSLYDFILRSVETSSRGLRTSRELKIATRWRNSRSSETALLLNNRQGFPIIFSLSNFRDLNLSMVLQNRRRDIVNRDPEEFFSLID